MRDLMNELLKVIKTHQDKYGLSYGEALGALKLLSDELSETCRKAEEGKFEY